MHVVAIVSGLLAFLLILSWMRGQQEVVKVAIANETIRAGNVVTTDQYDMVDVPVAGTFGGRVVTEEGVEGLTGSVATRGITPGEPLLVTDFRPISTPEGFRAMSIPLDINQAVGGALVAGDRVDIIGFDDGGPFYIATDIAVLDVPGESGSAFGSSARFAITLAVDDAQALAIAAALDVDDLHVLRSTGAPVVTSDRLDAAGDGANAGGAADSGGGEG